MVIGGQLAIPNPGAARKHVHVPRDVRAIPLQVTIKRTCAGTTAPTARELTNVKVLDFVRGTTRPVFFIAIAASHPIIESEFLIFSPECQRQTSTSFERSDKPSCKCLGFMKSVAEDMCSPADIRL